MVNWGALIALIAVIAFFAFGGLNLIKSGVTQIKSGFNGITKGGGSESGVNTSQTNTNTNPDFNSNSHITNTNVSNTGSGGQGITPSMLIKQKFNAETKTGFDVSGLSGGKVIDTSINQGLPNFANTGNFSRGSALEISRAQQIAQADLLVLTKEGISGHKAGFDFVDAQGNVI